MFSSLALRCAGRPLLFREITPMLFVGVAPSSVSDTTAPLFSEVTSLFALEEAVWRVFLRTKGTSRIVFPLGIGFDDGAEEEEEEEEGD